MLRKITTDTLKAFLLSDQDNVTFFKSVFDDIKQMITTAIVNQDLETLEYFTERVKLCNDNNLVNYLKRAYSVILEGQSFCHVIVLRGKTSKTFRKIPLQALSKAHISKVDENELISVAISMLSKMLLSFDQKKQFISTSIYKMLSDECMDTLTEHEVMVRVESVNIHGKKKHKVEAIRKDQLSRILSTSGGNKSYHQIIDSDMIRLFFDIDSSYSQDDLNHELTRLIGFLPHHSVLKSDGKDSYHVYYDVNVSITYAKWIANKLQQHIPAIDAAPYGINKSLRLPNSIKISQDGQKIDKRYPCQFDLVQKHLIGSEKHFTTIYQPLHTIENNIIDTFYEQKVDHTADDLKTIGNYFTKLGINHTLSE